MRPDKRVKLTLGKRQAEALFSVAMWGLSGMEEALDNNEITPLEYRQADDAISRLVWAMNAAKETD